MTGRNVLSLISSMDRALCPVIPKVRVGFLLKRKFFEGREGVKWELGLALLWTGKMGFTHWDWDLATGNGMNNYKMGMGFLFFSGLCSNILK